MSSDTTSPIILKLPSLSSSSSSAGNSSTPSEIITTNHLLSLPPIFETFSPALSALHLARIRLLLSIPASVHPMFDRWCSSCGMPKVSRKKGLLPKKSTCSPASPLQEGIDGGNIVDKVKSKYRTKSGSPGKKRFSGQCTFCDQSSHRPGSLQDRISKASFPSARKVSATRRSSRISTKEEEEPSTTTTLEDTISLPLSQTTINTDNDINTSSTKPRPTLLSTPSLKYIPKEDPNPPSCPPPKPSFQLLSTSSSDSSVSGVGTKRAGSPPGTAGGSKKKRKKSGLAKLLAESKSREENDAGVTGRWGLG